MLTFANSLDPDHARQNVWPDLDHSSGIPERMLEKDDLKLKSANDKTHLNLPRKQRVTVR